MDLEGFVRAAAGEGQAATVARVGRVHPELDLDLLHDALHTQAGMVVLIIEDLVVEAIDARHDDGRVDIGVEDQNRPVRRAVSDNGPQRPPARRASS